MPSSRVPVALIALALVGCGTPGRAPPPYFAIPAGPVGQNRTPAQPTSANPVLIVPSPNPDVQTFIQPHEGEFMRGPAPVQEPSRTAVPLYAQPPNIGHTPISMVLSRFRRCDGTSDEGQIQQTSGTVL